jgi:hypothetical protein
MDLMTMQKVKVTDINGNVLWFNLEKDTAEYIKLIVNEFNSALGRLKTEIIKVNKSLDELNSILSNKKEYN